ncbi:hypothetical protein SCHPADRAFT_896564 [Schizopora paradoxa]|uniref:Uncharacterized protein n=1 Tax=Schizopora paradoxa TaxID=27342 RepID=A0A0H2R049_9AGAM|nr:hypothetical protein SCHPADRAFT_896564 [Schizopora paradoxa]
MTSSRRSIDGADGTAITGERERRVGGGSKNRRRACTRCKTRGRRVRGALRRDVDESTVIERRRRRAPSRWERRWEGAGGKMEARGGDGGPALAAKREVGRMEVGGGHGCPRRVHRHRTTATAGALSLGKAMGGCWRADGGKRGRRRACARCKTRGRADGGGWRARESKTSPPPSNDGDDGRPPDGKRKGKVLEGRWGLEAAAAGLRSLQNASSGGWRWVKATGVHDESIAVERRRRRAPSRWETQGEGAGGPMEARGSGGEPALAAEHEFGRVEVGGGQGCPRRVHRRRTTATAGSLSRSNAMGGCWRVLGGSWKLEAAAASLRSLQNAIEGGGRQVGTTGVGDESALVERRRRRAPARRQGQWEGDGGRWVEAGGWRRRRRACARCRTSGEGREVGLQAVGGKRSWRTPRGPGTDRGHRNRAPDVPNRSGGVNAAGRVFGASGASPANGGLSVHWTACLGALPTLSSVSAALARRFGTRFAGAAPHFQVCFFGALGAVREARLSRRGGVAGGFLLRLFARSFSPGRAGACSGCSLMSFILFPHRSSPSGEIFVISFEKTISKCEIRGIHDVVRFLETHATQYRGEKGVEKKNKYAEDNLVEEVHRLLGREYDDIKKKIATWYGNYYQAHREGQATVRARKVGKKGKWTFRKVTTRIYQDDIRAERDLLVQQSKDKGEQKGYLAYIQTAISNVVKEVMEDNEKRTEIEGKVEKWNEKLPLKILIDNANHPTKGVPYKLAKDCDTLNDDMGCKTFTLAWYLDKDRKPRLICHETGKGTGNSFTENVPDWMTNPEWTKLFKKHWNRVHRFTEEEMNKLGEQGDEEDDEEDEVRADFAITFSQDRKTVTFLPPIEDFRLPALKNGVRLILNTIFGAFADDKSLPCPWLSLGANTEMFFEPGSVPKGTTFRDPSKMRGEELTPIYNYCIRFRPEAFHQKGDLVEEEEEEIQYPSDIDREDEEDEEEEEKEEPVKVQPKKKKSKKGDKGKGKAMAMDVQEEEPVAEPEDEEEPGESLLDDPKDDDGMVSAMTTDPKDLQLQTYLSTLKPLERAYTKLLEKVFNIPEVGLTTRRMPGGRLVPKWLDLTKRPSYLPKDIHELRGFTAFLDWAKERSFTGATGSLVVKELLLQLCLGIGLLLREISFINDTEDGEFPEDAPIYLRDSRLDMGKYEEIKKLIYHTLFNLKQMRAGWLKSTGASGSGSATGVSETSKSTPAENPTENQPENEPSQDVDMEGPVEAEQDPVPAPKKSKRLASKNDATVKAPQDKADGPKDAPARQAGKKTKKVAEEAPPESSSSPKKRKEVEGTDGEEGGSVPKKKKTGIAPTRVSPKKATVVKAKINTRSAASGSKPTTRSSKQGGA